MPGQVFGRRVRGRIISEGDEFKRVFGTSLDRIGEANRKFLSVMENGIPPSWEERALHVDSFGGPYDTSVFHSLPRGWSIEVSEVEPALGQPGGAIQVRIMDGDGNVIQVKDLIRLRVLGK